MSGSLTPFRLINMDGVQNVAFVPFITKKMDFFTKLVLEVKKKQRGGTCLIPLDASYTFNMFYTIFERQHNYPKKE